MADILKKLESNTIYFKVLPGIKATTLEIETDRHSLIMEANVPVIKGKRKATYLKRKVFGVYEGVNVDDVINYMSSSSVKYKKIMVTPESFFKVKEAAEILEIELFKEYYFLFDECDRTMKDVAFRKKIILPMDDFFKFKNKAFISATAVVPSDPRFIEQNFTQVILEPTFDYGKPVEVLITNNVSVLLKEKIQENQDSMLCIFLNSIQAITSVIEDLQIKKECHIYCSKEKMYTLKTIGYNTFDNVPSDDRSSFANINFFTSRFNSAVDIMMNVNPIVIMATNLFFARHTMIDPRSEAVQIVGRFRNGVDKIIAITNIDKDLDAKTHEESIGYLEGCEESYSTIKTLRNSANNEGAKNTLDEALALVKYSEFVNEDGTKNHYMFDNFLYEESVKTIFESEDNFKAAYCNNYFKPTFEERNYVISDKDYKVAKNGISIKSLVQLIVNTIKRLTENPMAYQVDNRDVVMKELERSYPHIYQAYHVLGEQELIKNSYSKKQMKDAVKKKIELIDKRNFSFIHDLNHAFVDGYKAATKIILKHMQAIIDKHGLNLRASIKLFQEYFKTSARTTIKQPDTKGYVVYSAKFNRDPDTK
ncbi:hypothetical protein EZ449_21995 [Pedobacter frigidisoli]|uniref:Uncharacterized protein n=1 Tax=Pedobacter frigidisoli TaxID=2530455 RepID=A0A4R0NE01_9SPHI|nr:hypothetical protein [Pedobacter frigidisoli]TCC97493.1 hypothetical protein EZ449_21995 [Pedobacter frigidisoli]